MSIKRNQVRSGVKLPKLLLCYSCDELLDTQSITHEDCGQSLCNQCKSSKLCKCEIWEAEAVLDKKETITGETVYWMKWKNWSEEHNTWEPIENLVECEELIENYNNGTQPSPITASIDSDEDQGWFPVSKAIVNEIHQLPVICPNRDYGCEQDIKAGELKQHVEFNCNYSAQCYECEQFVKESMLKYHKQNLCPQRTVECPYCHTKDKCVVIDEHEKDIRLCLKVCAVDMIQHPLVKSKSSKEMSETQEDDCSDFIVPDRFKEKESKHKIAKQYDQWRRKQKARV